MDLTTIDRKNDETESHSSEVVRRLADIFARSRTDSFSLNKLKHTVGMLQSDVTTGNVTNHSSERTDTDQHAQQSHTHAATDDDRDTTINQHGVDNVGYEHDTDDAIASCSATAENSSGSGKHVTSNGAHVVSIVGEAEEEERPTSLDQFSVLIRLKMCCFKRIIILKFGNNSNMVKVTYVVAGVYLIFSMCLLQACVIKQPGGLPLPGRAGGGGAGHVGDHWSDLLQPVAGSSRSARSLRPLLHRRRPLPLHGHTGRHWAM